MLDSFYHMTLRLLKIRIFGVKTSRFYPSLTQYYVNKSVNQWWFTDFIAWCYITPCTTSCDK